MNRHCFSLDLFDDPELISAYKQYHEKIWPEIEQSITETGITQLEIYLIGNRMFMIMEVNDEFSFEKKTVMDKENPKVQKGEKLMWK